MEKRIETIERDFISRVGKIAKQWGIGEPAGRVWATLLFQDKPLTQREIAKKTKYSLSLVSPSLNILEKLGIIRISDKKDREKLYEAVGSFIDAFNQLLQRFMNHEVKPLIDTLENVKGVKEQKTRQRLEIIAKEYRRLDLLLKIFSRIIETKKSLTLDKLRNFSP